MTSDDALQALTEAIAESETADAQILGKTMAQGTDCVLVSREWLRDLLTALAAPVADVNLHETLDAAVWAKEWVRIAREIEAAKDGRVVIDEGWMLSWFANAIMVGWDHANRRAPLHSSPVAAEPPSLVALVQEWQAAKATIRRIFDAWDSGDEGPCDAGLLGPVVQRRKDAEAALLAWTPAQAEPAAPDDWQPIETAPKDSAVMLWIPRRFPCVVVGSFWETDDSQWGWWACSQLVEPTHWMQLPSEPAALAASSPAAQEKQ